MEFIFSELSASSFPVKLTSLLYEVVTVCIRLLKALSSALLKYEAVVCVQSVVRSGGRSLAESAMTIRELVKSALRRRA